MREVKIKKKDGTKYHTIDFNKATRRNCINATGFKLEPKDIVVVDEINDVTYIVGVKHSLNYKKLKKLVDNADAIIDHVS